MHPKAKQLALAGFVPMAYIPSRGPDRCRIKRQQHPREDYLCWMRGTQRWSIERASWLSEYESASWAAWTDAQWDMLPDTLIEKLIQGEQP